MRIPDDTAYFHGIPPGDYFFAKGPLPGVELVTDLRVIRYWAAAFDRWITEAMHVIERHKAGKPLPGDPPEARARRHLDMLRGEARSGQRVRLYRRK